MKILVTGVAGFIGSFLTRRLVEKGHDVIGIDNFDDFYSKKSKEFNLDLIRCCSNLKFENADAQKIFELLKNQRNESRGVKKSGNFEFSLAAASIRYRCPF